MGWRTVSGHKYFYLSCRFYDEVRTTYLGNGAVAKREALKLEQRKQARVARRGAKADIARLREFGEQTSGEIDLLVRVTLTVAGFYRHNRGPWRRRRYRVPEDYPVVQPTFTDVKELIRRANAGDPEAVAAMRKYLREHPRVWQQTSDLTSRAMEARIRRIARDNTSLAESIRLRVEKFRKGLASSEPTVVESMAIDGVVLAWMELHQVDLAAQVERNVPYQDLSRPLEKAAWQRFTSAMRLLIFVREKLPDIERVSRELQLGRPPEEQYDPAAVDADIEGVKPLLSAGDSEAVP